MANQGVHPAILVAGGVGLVLVGAGLYLARSKDGGGGGTGQGLVAVGQPSLTVNGLVPPAAYRAVQRVVARSHFSVARVVLPPGNGLFVQCIWPVRQTSIGSENCYLELKIVRPRTFLPDTTLVDTLPDNRFTTEMDPALVAQVISPVHTISTGQTVDVNVQVFFRHDATPPPVSLDIYLALRVVRNRTANNPGDVGPIMIGGEHVRQQDVIEVVETALAAIGQPGMTVLALAE